jgi:hypothetical protein
MLIDERQYAMIDALGLLLILAHDAATLPALGVRRCMLAVGDPFPRKGSFSDSKALLSGMRTTKSSFFLSDMVAAIWPSREVKRVTMKEDRFRGGGRSY